MEEKIEVTEEKLSEFEKQTKDKFTKLLIKSLKDKLKQKERNEFYEQIEIQRISNLIKREKNREALTYASAGLEGNRIFILKISKGKESYLYDVQGHMKLAWLSNMIQREFDLEPGHLYEFQIGKYKFGPECDEWQETFDWLDSFRIDAAINAAGLKKGDKINFTYDFGENIKLKIEIGEIK